MSECKQCAGLEGAPSEFILFSWASLLPACLQAGLQQHGCCTQAKAQSTEEGEDGETFCRFA